jgi:hypothetical protein
MFHLNLTWAMVSVNRALRKHDNINLSDFPEIHSYLHLAQSVYLNWSKLPEYELHYVLKSVNLTSRPATSERRKPLDCP